MEYGIHPKETNIMNQSPVGVGIKGFLHGFSALYGLSIGGFLLVFAMSFMLSGDPQLLVMAVGLIGFVAFCILGVILKLLKPDIFLVKEEHLLTIKLEGSKTPDGQITTEMTQLSKPSQHLQISSTLKDKGRIQ